MKTQIEKDRVREIVQNTLAMLKDFPFGREGLAAVAGLIFELCGSVEQAAALCDEFTDHNEWPGPGAIKAKWREMFGGGSAAQEWTSPEKPPPPTCPKCLDTGTVTCPVTKGWILCDECPVGQTPEAAATCAAWNYARSRQRQETERRAHHGVPQQREIERVSQADIAKVLDQQRKNVLAAAGKPDDKEAEKGPVIQ